MDNSSRNSPRIEHEEGILASHNPQTTGTIIDYTRSPFVYLVQDLNIDQEAVN